MDLNIDCELDDLDDFIEDAPGDMGRSLSLVLALSPRVIWSNSRRFLSVIFCGLL